jgi:hypothetical protein
MLKLNQNKESLEMIEYEISGAMSAATSVIPDYEKIKSNLTTKMPTKRAGKQRPKGHCILSKTLSYGFPCSDRREPGKI